MYLLKIVINGQEEAEESQYYVINWVCTSPVYDKLAMS